MQEELARLDGIAQAELVRRGEVTPAELVEAAIYGPTRNPWKLDHSPGASRPGGARDGICS